MKLTSFASFLSFVGNQNMNWEMTQARANSCALVISYNWVLHASLWFSTYCSSLLFSSGPGGLLILAVQWMNSLWSICMGQLDLLGISFHFGIPFWYAISMLQYLIKCWWWVSIFYQSGLNKLLSILPQKPFLMLLGIMGQRAQI